MHSNPQALWDQEDAACYRERVRKSSQAVLVADERVACCRAAWLEARKALAKAEAAVTKWALAVEPIPPAIFLQSLEALEAEVQRCEDETRRTKQQLNAARASRGQLWNERRVCIRQKFEKYPLEEFAARQLETNGHAAEVHVETARVPAEQLAEALEQEHPPICDKQGPGDSHCTKRRDHSGLCKFERKPETPKRRSVTVMEGATFELLTTSDKDEGEASAVLFGNWNMNDLAMDEYWPTMEQISEAATRVAGYTLECWEHYPSDDYGRLILLFRRAGKAKKEPVIEKDMERLLEQESDADAQQQTKKPRRRRKEQA